MVISTGKCSGSGTVNKSTLESLNQVVCLRVKPIQQPEGVLCCRQRQAEMVEVWARLPSLPEKTVSLVFSMLPSPL